MKNQNITFQQFLEKIKTIDVGELLEKAKTIKVEDIKSIKLSDLKEITKWEPEIDIDQTLEDLLNYWLKKIN